MTILNNTISKQPTIQMTAIQCEFTKHTFQKQIFNRSTSECDCLASQQPSPELNARFFRLTTIKLCELALNIIRLNNFKGLKGKSISAKWLRYQWDSILMIFNNIGNIIFQMFLKSLIIMNKFRNEYTLGTLLSRICLSEGLIYPKKVKNFYVFCDKQAQIDKLEECCVEFCK